METTITLTVTYGAALAAHQITVPEHLVAQAEVPVLGGMQRQGDLLIDPDHDGEAVTPIPQTGVQLVVGEATGNTHWLDGPGCFFDRAEGHAVGVVTVPAGLVAVITHTDEHGANALAPGTYTVKRARVQGDEIRVVAD